MTVCNSEFHHSNHAFWIKNHSYVETENSKLHHQTGTQVIVQHESHFEDHGSLIEHGSGNGIYATKNSLITMHKRDHRVFVRWTYII